MRKRVQKRPTEANKLLLKKYDKFLKLLLKRHQSKHFEKFIKKFIADGSIWKFSNEYSKKSKSSTTLYDKDNKELKTDLDRANAFAEHFSKMSSTFDDLGTKYFNNKVTQTVKKFLKLDSNLNEVKVTNFREVVNVIKSLKNNKASGHDQISARVLKNLPRKAIVYIIKMVNGILCTSHIPTDWKISKIIPILKKIKILLN